MAANNHKTRIPSINDLVSKVSHSEIASINTVVQKLLEIIGNPASGAMDLKKEIEVDPPLSAKVLRHANSAYFGVKRKIATIQEAIVYIGFNNVREMAFSLKVGEFFSSSQEIFGYSRKKLWEHSVGVALIAKNIYRREFRMEGNDIYSSALLHDLGMIVEEQFFEDEFTAALTAVGSGKGCGLDPEREIFGYTHCDIGYKLMESWNLPKDTVIPVLCHHNPFLVDPAFIKGALAVFVSEQLCVRFGIGYDPLIVNDEQGFAKALEALELDPKAVELIAQDMLEELARMRESGEI